MRISLILIFIFSVFLAFGCKGENDENLQQYESLRSLPPQERVRALVSLTPEKQVELYVWSIRYYRPADLLLASALAKQGKPIIGPLITELEKPESASITQELVMVLYQMAIVYQIEIAEIDDGKISAWCDRFYKRDSYCHEMGNEIEKMVHKNTN